MKKPRGSVERHGPPGPGAKNQADPDGVDAVRASAEDRAAMNRQDARAKNQGHGKKTADKWNQ